MLLASSSLIGNIARISDADGCKAPAAWLSPETSATFARATCSTIVFFTISDTSSVELALLNIPCTIFVTEVLLATCRAKGICS